MSQTPPQAKADCEALMAQFVPFAEQQLERHGEFFPFGGAIRSDGKFISVAGYDGTGTPPSVDIINLLKAGFAEGARKQEYKATALIYDVKVRLPSGDRSDAIAVSLDHRDNYSVIVMLPYRLVDGKVVFGETLGQPGEADIFRQR